MIRRAWRGLGASWRGGLIGALCGVACWWIAGRDVFRGLEEWCQDACFAWREARVPRTKVAIIGIDEETLDALPKPLSAISPELAEVVAYAHRRGARAIGVDFFVPSSLDGYDHDPGLGGKLMGKAVGQAGNVVLPALLAAGEAGLIQPLQSWRAESVEPPGFVALSSDRDQFVRRQLLFATFGTRRVSHLAVRLLEVAGRRVEPDGDGIAIDGHPVPLDEKMLRINFVGPPGSIKPHGFMDVLAAARGERPGIDLDGAIVIVGVTARSMNDYHTTPFANGTWLFPRRHPPDLMSGPEIHANIVATLDDGDFIATPRWLRPSVQSIVAGTVLGMALARMSLAAGFLLAFVHHWAWKVAAATLFARFGWRVEMVAVLLTGIVCYATIFCFRWLWIRRTLGAVKGEAVARALESDPGRRLRGEERVVSVLFADIRDFTAFADARGPSEVVALLNAYFAAIVPIVESEGGTVDKYIGDGLMAIFGAPRSLPDHAASAVRAAVKMVRRVHASPDEWARLGCERLRIGVGIETGPAVVGTIGSPRRLDFTAIGDTVNAASRIESANKLVGSEILIGDRTHRALLAGTLGGLGCASTPIEVEVKGKSAPLALHRVAIDVPAPATIPTPREPADPPSRM